MAATVDVMNRFPPPKFCGLLTDKKDERQKILEFDETVVVMKPI